MDVRVELWRKLSAEELMLLNCGVGEDSWESLGLQGDRSWVFIGRTDAEAKTPVLWPPYVKSWLIGKVYLYIYIYTHRILWKIFFFKAYLHYGEILCVMVFPPLCDGAPVQTWTPHWLAVMNAMAETGLVILRVGIFLYNLKNITSLALIQRALPL